MFLFTGLSFGFAILGVVFVSSHRKHALDLPAKLSHNIHRSPLLSPPCLVLWATGCILHISPSHFHQRRLMFIHGTLLYLSIDGVIPEAFINVYIPYNISRVCWR